MKTFTSLGKLFLGVLLAGLIVTGTSVTASAEKVLRIGATPGENIEVTRERYQHIIDYI